LSVTEVNSQCIPTLFLLDLSTKEYKDLSNVNVWTEKTQTSAGCPRIGLKSRGG